MGEHHRKHKAALGKNVFSITPSLVRGDVNEHVHEGEEDEDEDEDEDEENGANGWPEASTPPPAPAPRPPPPVLARPACINDVKSYKIYGSDSFRLCV